MKPVHAAAAGAAFLAIGGVALFSKNDQAVSVPSSIVVVPGASPTPVARRARVEAPAMPSPAPTAYSEPVSTDGVASVVGDEAPADMPTNGNEDLASAPPGVQIP